MKMVHDREEGHVIEAVGALPPADRRSAFANAPMGIALTTVEGVLVDANPALCTMLGRTADELYGRGGHGGPGGLPDARRRPRPTDAARDPAAPPGGHRRPGAGHRVPGRGDRR